MRAVPFIGVLAIIQRFGRFSSPLRNSKVFYIPPFNERHSLSHAHWACQLPQGGSRDNIATMPITRPLTKHQRVGDFLGSVCGVMFCHSTGCLQNRKVTGDFHRPYERVPFN